jgi:S-adenosylmethionine decarboxylase
MNVGVEWLVDAAGCCPDALRDVALLRQLCAQVIADLELHVVGEGVWHPFPAPGGVTGLYLLTESHLACHTYPEIGVATFNLYCCRTRPRWPWRKKLRALLGATRVSVRSTSRGERQVRAGARKPEGGAR